MSESFLSFDFSLSRTVVVLLAVLVFALFDIMERLRHREAHYVFAVLMGTAMSMALIKSTRVLLSPGVSENTHIVAFGVVLIALLWRLLFGPWEASTKATVLGTFIFWVTVHMLWRQPVHDRMLMILAILIALLPAVIWCSVFLKYHTERMSRVFLMFFSGMIATIPVLFYDALVRHHVELQFFIIRIVPESFSRITRSFVAGQLMDMTPVSSTLITVFLSFFFVALIEELSKFWVLRKSGARLFTSIDDVMQFSILVAIGFAFAENVANPTYFVSFLREYIVTSPGKEDILGFFGNVAGRSILTTMVHVTSTGIMGYFLGLAIFAGPYLQDERAKGKRYIALSFIHRMFRIDSVSIFRTQMILTGIILAIFLHAFSNFLVTLPEILPGNPSNLGELFGLNPGSVLHVFSLLLVPALLYVVGGFWILSVLFVRKENMKERGELVGLEV